MEPNTSPRRFFVRIEAADQAAASALRNYGLDIFRATAVRAAAAQRAALDAGAAPGPLTLDGLLTLQEVERLVLEGYRVTIDGEAGRGRPAVVEFDEWLEGQGS